MGEGEKCLCNRVLFRFLELSGEFSRTKNIRQKVSGFRLGLTPRLIRAYKVLLSVPFCFPTPLCPSLLSVSRFARIVYFRFVPEEPANGRFS